MHEISIHKNININKVDKTLTYAGSVHKIRGKGLLSDLQKMKNEIDFAVKENRELRKFLREIKNFPEFGEVDCGLDIPDGDCPVINCSQCLATYALKKKRPKFREYRRV